MNNCSDLILLNVGYSEMDADWNWNNICSPFARIYFVVSGKAQIRTGENVFDITPDHLYLIPPFTRHDDRCHSDFSLYYIHFYEDVAGGHPLFLQNDYPLGVEASSLDLSLIQRLHEINPGRELPQYDPRTYDNPLDFSRFISSNKKQHPGVLYETRGILFQLMSRFVSLVSLKESIQDERVVRIIQMVYSDLQGRFQLADLAAAVHVSVDHLIRIFRKEVGDTPLNYILNRKIEHAQLMMMTTELSIAEIASSLSFDDLSYFNRIFRRKTGITPGQYRKRAFLKE